MKFYQRCTYCILDTTDKDITFDIDGRCSHCSEWLPRVQNLPQSTAETETNLDLIAKKLKLEGKGKRYDCMIGLSGGVDSSYIVYLAHKMNLRPLIVHFDNGWNSELAISNIEKIVKKCDFELTTLVVEWKEFRELQKAYLSASVIDIEVATDHAIIATMFQNARKYNIKYLLSGGNIATETGMPNKWTWPKKDLTNLKNIHRAFSTVPLKTYPTRSIWTDIFEKKFLSQVVDIRILDQIKYNKSEAIKMLEEQFGWQYYGGKHYESVFTKFYQAYILPTKFKIDKRLVHLSSLIRNGEMTRKDALEELELPLYVENIFLEDREYVLKKLEMSSAEFASIMKAEPIEHIEYGSDYINLNKLKWIYRILKNKKQLFVVKK